MNLLVNFDLYRYLFHTICGWLVQEAIYLFLYSKEPGVVIATRRDL
jgi:hypothetical protein